MISLFVLTNIQGCDVVLKAIGKLHFAFPALRALQMSSPPPINPDHVDHDFAFPFCASDDLWPLLEDSNIFLATEDYDRDIGLDPNRLHQEKFSVPGASIDIEGLLENRLEHYIENSLLSVPFEGSDNLQNKINSELFLEQENSAMAEPIIGKGLRESSNKYHEDNSTLPTTLKTSEIILCPSVDGSSMSLSRKKNDSSSTLNPNIFLDQENSALEPSIHRELQEDHRVLSNCKYNCIETYGNPWPLLEEGRKTLLQSNGIGGGLESSMLPEQETSAVAISRSNDKELLQKRFISAKKKERNRRFKRLQVDKTNVSEGLISKKEDHNAKEKERRIKLNASYLALGALLPDSRRKKKRRSAAAIIDRALEYIPELENETQKLTLKKNTLLSTTESENKHNKSRSSTLEHPPHTVSVHEVKKGEVIIQITRILNDEDTVFSKLLEKAEAEGMSIISTSTLQVCEKRVCYHLHVQMNGSSLAADYVAILRENIISWLH